METQITDVKGAGSILRAFRAANEIANQSQNWDVEIAAYRQVIALGNKNSELAPEDRRKHDMIMYWAYNNVAEAFFKQSFEKKDGDEKRKNYYDSLQYYQLGIPFAKDNLERASSLYHIAENYKYLEDEVNLCKIRQQIIESLKDEDKRLAYFELAASLQNQTLAATFYEEALLHINNEEVSFLAKCLHTLQICEGLLAIYGALSDTKDAKRIQSLKEKTTFLALRILDDRLDMEDNHTKKLSLWSQRLELENKYLSSPLTNACLLRRLLATLEDEEEVKADGVRYNKVSIRNLLKKLI